MNHTKKRKIYIAFSALAITAVAVIIFYLSAQTADESSEVSGSLIAWIYSVLGLFFTQDTIRTIAHFCEYALFGFLTANLIYACKNSVKPFFSILFSWLYAWTDEVHQIFVEGRAFQLSDLAVDLGGVSLGSVIFAFIIFIVKGIISKKNGKRQKQQANNS